MKINEWNGLELWIYTPQGKAYGGRYGSRTTTYNIHVVLGFRKLFKNIRSAQVAHYTVDERVVRGDWKWDSAMAKAERLRDNPAVFIKTVTGHKADFMRECEKFKAKMMERILRDSL